jgi:aspartate aminotransferase
MTQHQQGEQTSSIRQMFEEAAKLKERLGEQAVFDFSLGNPVAPPPPEFTESLRHAVSDSPPGAHRYMNNAGYPEVRAAVAVHFQREYGVAMTAAQVVMCCGAAGGLNVVLKALLDPGDEVIALSPYFPEYPFYADNHGGVLRLVESTFMDFQPDADRFAAAITPRTKAFILNSPNNPTGVVYSGRALEGLAEAAREAERRLGHPIYLLADDIYRHILYDGALVPSMPAVYRNTVVVNSFSKDLGVAGERIGYIAIPPEADDAPALAEACTTATRILGFVNAPALMQRTVARCLSSGSGLGARVDVTLYQRNRDVLCAALEKAGFGVRKPQGAFYIFARCPDAYAEDDVACCAALRSKGIFMVPGSGFGRPGYVRVAYSVPHETCVAAATILTRNA